MNLIGANSKPQGGLRYSGYTSPKSKHYTRYTGIVDRNNFSRCIKDRTTAGSSR